MGECLQAGEGGKEGKKDAGREAGVSLEDLAQHRGKTDGQECSSRRTWWLPFDPVPPGKSPGINGNL